MAVILAAILFLLAQRIQAAVRSAFRRRPALLPAGAAGLAAAFWAMLAAVGAWNWPLALLVLTYLLAPALVALRLGTGPPKRPKPADFAILLMLWLPLEFAAGRQWVARPTQGLVHSLAYGFAILLALIIFLCFRGFPGLKYNLPSSRRDALYPLIGFVVAAPLLIAVGLSLGFIPDFHWPAHSGAATMLARFLVIFAATALPEEILFRSLMQNLLMLRFGSNYRTLGAAALIFGCAHLNNGPQLLPNWRYAIVATIAGAAFGKVFEKSSTVLSSASLHAMVNTAKYAFF